MCSGQSEEGSVPVIKFQNIQREYWKYSLVEVKDASKKY